MKEEHGAKTEMKEFDGTEGDDDPEIAMENSSEKGWDWVEEKLIKKDTAKMKDYTDDIDALLTLDGLFSAVVTGFIVYSILMLQEDTGGKTVDLLAQISGKLDKTSLTYAHPFINSTIRATSDSTTVFKPTHGARSVNILWFISLILSLASAVYGIMAKQWIREYLQWRSPTAGARSNLILRQLRNEQWKQWHAPFIIALIPALLELAVILFVCGMLVLLKDLDIIVFIPVAAVAAVFLFTIAFFTLTPALSKRCAYKSPTALAVVIFLHRLRKFARLIFPASKSTSSDLPHTSSATSSYGTHFHNVHSHIPLIGAGVTDVHDAFWRNRDLQSAEITLLLDSEGRTAHAQRAFLDELDEALKYDQVLTEPAAKKGTEGHSNVRQWLDLPHDYSGDSHASPVDNHTSNDLSVLPGYVRALSESDILFKVLIDAASELSKVDAFPTQLEHCVHSIQPPELSCAAHYSSIEETKTMLAELAVHGGFQTLSVWYMLSRVNAHGDAYMGPFTKHPRVIAQGPGNIRTVAGYITSTLPVELSSDQIDLVVSVEPPQLQTMSWHPPRAGDSPAVDEFLSAPSHAPSIVMGYVLAARLRDVVMAQALHPSVLQEPCEDKVVKLVYIRMTRLLQVLQWLVICTDEDLPQWRRCRSRCAKLLETTLNLLASHEVSDKFDARFPKVRFNMYQMLSYNETWTIKLTVTTPGVPIARPAVHIKIEERRRGKPKPTPSGLLRMLSKLDALHLRSDCYIVSQIVSDAIAELDHRALAVERTAHLFRAATQTVQAAIRARDAGDSESWDPVLTSICYTWTVQLAPSTDGLSPLIAIALQNKVIATQVVNLVLHLSFTFTTAPRTVQNLGEGLSQATEFLLRFPLGSSPSDDWFTIFVWVADWWLVQIHAELSTARDEDTPKYLQAVKQVLPLMAKAAESVSFQYVVNDDVEYPWAVTMFSSNGESRAESLSKVAEVEVERLTEALRDATS